jgi:ribosome-associated protein
MTDKNIQKIMVNSFPITLTQFMKWGGLVLTGGEAKELVREGYVLLNGEKCLVAGHKLQPGDLITLLGEEEMNYQVVEQR